jgi:hypothetical protein
MNNQKEPTLSLRLESLAGPRADLDAVRAAFSSPWSRKRPVTMRRNAQ